MSYRLLTIIFLFVCLFIFNVDVVAKNSEMSAQLIGNTLTIQNRRIIQQWTWNNGDVSLYSLFDKVSGEKIEFGDDFPSFKLEGKEFVKNIDFAIEEVEKNVFYPAHLQVIIQDEYQDLELKRIFRIYPETEAVACEFYLKYHSLFINNNEKEIQATGAEHTVESHNNLKSHLLKYAFNEKHWKVKTVNFKDITDRNNNLVFETDEILYHGENKREGNLLLANNLSTGNGFFILKEAPNTQSQINYPGYDFALSDKGIIMPFSGFPNELNSDEWLKGYTITTGLCDSETNGLSAIRNYLMNSLNYSSDQYDMVMMNTWGDRGQDGKINEDFILAELEKAHQLGINVFQIDDGWQQGLSSNSAFKKDNVVLWDTWSPENWKPHKERFPNGFDKVFKAANEKDIELGLWFNPTKKNSYVTWETDANILIDIYKETGIRYFKIDGVALPDKLAEVNFNKFLTRVKEKSEGNVIFNLDLTAGIRGGYFSYRYAGNLFLENRYTDWGNYYPYQTLRNLWMLSKYFPPQLLQIEFLNKWRNAKNYGDDPFAPSRYSFDYLFATTMAAQPLAWLESTGLPQEAFTSAELIKKYKEIQTDFHNGTILPIGDEPSGTSWCGFQSIHDNHGYFLIFREKHELSKYEIKTYLKEGKMVKLTPLFGKSEVTKIQTLAEGAITFTINDPNDFILYQYEL
ncbi:MAG: alpha-galactosidase [Prolixibacteraceae bacterium]